MADRRAFLSGLVTLPLIGGGVTLIGRPAAAVPLVQAAALPTLDDPRQRARYAWAAFSAAMRDLTPPDAQGWRVVGAAEIDGVGSMPPVSYLDAMSVHLQVGLPGVLPHGIVVERSRPMDISHGEPVDRWTVERG